MSKAHKIHKDTLREFQYYITRTRSIGFRDMQNIMFEV